MPVRRDLTGYTYELEGLGDSSLSGAFVGSSSPSCMVEVLGKTMKIVQLFVSESNG